jgi:class 3 adenylate cyclase
MMIDASIADILKVYLGQNAGEAVLAGNISRGRSLKVTATILIVYIRGSTTLLQKRGTDSDINIINKPFDIVTPHFIANDGEVLQITGDRLAFTVISAGVNRADQLQSLCPLGIRMWLFRAIAPRISRMGRCGLLVIV